MSQPDPVYWTIDEPKKFGNALSQLPQEILAIYVQKIDNMIHSKNPAGHGDKWERTRYGQV